MESFVHGYRYLALRFHLTSVDDLRAVIASTFEQVIRQDGTFIGGEEKLKQFTSPTSPFQVVGNRELQRILNLLAKGCHSFYQKVNIDRMRASYGISSGHVQHPGKAGADNRKILQEDAFDELLAREVAVVLDEESDGEDSSTEDSDEDTTQSDPADVEGWLTGHVNLINVFKTFSKNSDVLQDKSEDRFVSARQRPVHDALPRMQSSDIASLSLSGTLEFRSRWQAAHSTGGSKSWEQLPSVSPRSPFLRSLSPHMHPLTPGASFESASVSSLGLQSRKRARECEDPDVAPVDLCEDERGLKRRAY